MFDFYIDGSFIAKRIQRRMTSAHLAELIPQGLQKFFFAHRSGIIQLWQGLVIAFSLAAAFFLRFDLAIPVTERRRLLLGLAIALVLRIAAAVFMSDQRLLDAAVYRRASEAATRDAR